MHHRFPPHSPGVLRSTGQATILLLATLAIIAGQMELRIADPNAARNTLSGSERTASATAQGDDLAQTSQGFLLSAIIPHTDAPPSERLTGVWLHQAEVFVDDRLSLSALPEVLAPPTEGGPPRNEIITYVVQAGDTVWGIAARFDISPDTILWANGKLEDNPDLLAVGQELLILPISGVYHIVGANETLAAIAGQYKVEPEVIAEFPLNNLTDADELSEGQALIVPGGQKPYVPRRVYAYSGPVPEDAATGTGSFGWPATGVITQKYWNRHMAIDIGAPDGNSVVAADSGYVIGVGRSDDGYGLHVVIDHRNGFQTLYAHLSVYYVDVGQSVKKGQLIGKIGTTGRTTGPHLHFEIVRNGVRRNPIGYLP